MRQTEIRKEFLIGFIGRIIELKRVYLKQYGFKEPIQQKETPIIIPQKEVPQPIRVSAPQQTIPSGLERRQIPIDKKSDDDLELIPANKKISIVEMDESRPTTIMNKQLAPQEFDIHPNLNNWRALSLSSMNRLKPMLQDPEVSAVECIGGGKPILVRKRGRVLPSRVVLTSEEINSIIEQFSQETRVPVEPGIFKAKIGNLTVTAIISGFVDNRFIISK